VSAKFWWDSLEPNPGFRRGLQPGALWNRGRRSWSCKAHLLRNFLKKIYSWSKSIIAPRNALFMYGDTTELVTALQQDKRRGCKGLYVTTRTGRTSAISVVRSKRVRSRGKTVSVIGIGGAGYWAINPPVTNLATPARSKTTWMSMDSLRRAISERFRAPMAGLIKTVQTGSEVAAWVLTKAGLFGVRRPSFFASARERRPQSVRTTARLVPSPCGARPYKKGQPAPISTVAKLAERAGCNVSRHIPPTCLQRDWPTKGSWERCLLRRGRGLLRSAQLGSAIGVRPIGRRKASRTQLLRLTSARETTCAAGGQLGPTNEFGPRR